jgi:glycosyltransferase involved in cell wall biosynthesis
MAVGVPYIATPVGASAEIGEVETTHFLAATSDQWRSGLETLIADPERRQKMGAAGRRYVVEHYGLPAQADKLAAALRDAAGKA